MPFDHLWATWRSSYLSSLADGGDAPEGTERASDRASGPSSGDDARSLFERILDAPGSDSEKGIIYRGDKVFVIINRFPYTSGHSMVLPNRAVPDLAQLTQDEYSELWDVVRLTAAAINSAFAPEGLNVGLNLGRASGGSQNDHLHVHVVPRWVGDANFMSVGANVRVMPMEVTDAAGRIRANWPSSAS